MAKQDFGDGTHPGNTSVRMDCSNINDVRDHLEQWASALNDGVDQKYQSPQMQAETHKFANDFIAKLQNIDNLPEAKRPEALVEASQTFYKQMTGNGQTPGLDLNHSVAASDKYIARFDLDGQETEGHFKGRDKAGVVAGTFENIREATAAFASYSNVPLTLNSAPAPVPAPAQPRQNPAP